MDWFYRKLWSITDSVRQSIREVGDYLQFITPVGFLIWAACYGDHTVAKVFVATYVITTLIQVFLKALFYNARPSTGEDKVYSDTFKFDVGKDIVLRKAEIDIFSVTIGDVLFFHNGKELQNNGDYILEYQDTGHFTLYFCTDFKFFIEQEINPTDDIEVVYSVNEVDTTNQDLDVDWSPNDQDSFPSGHTMSAMVGGIFWFEINWWVGTIGLLLGLFCGLSRIIAKAHWVRDVLTSTIIAIASYLVAVEYFLGGL